MTRKKPKKRKYRRRFTGERTDTKFVRTHTANDGIEYSIRENGSKYPKLTSIPVSQSTRRVCRSMREIGEYDNYDELFLDLAELWLSRKPLPEEEAAVFKKSITRAKIDRRFRKIARMDAIGKHRYFVFPRT